MPAEALGGRPATESTTTHSPFIREIVVRYLKANWIGWQAFVSVTRSSSSLPLSTVRAFSALRHLLCPLLTPAPRSGPIARPSANFRGTPLPRARCRPPGVSSCSFGAQARDLRGRLLMDMDFEISRSLVQPWRLLSRFCSSPRTFAPRCLQTSPRDDALALRSPSPPSGWQRDFHPLRPGTCPAHVRHPPQSGWLDEWGRLKGGHPRL